MKDLCFQIIILDFSEDEAEGPSDPRKQEVVHTEVAIGRRRILHDLLNK